MPVTQYSACPTIAALYVDGELEEAEKPRYFHDAELNTRVAIWQGDITKLEIDAIVNAANRSLLGGGGVDGAIHRAAGPELLAECETLDGCETGDAKITKGYELPAKHVIHAVGPVYSSSKKEESAEKLKGAYQRCLELATEKKLKTIAFNCISTGIYGYPINAATEIAMTTVRDYLLADEGKELELVVFCIFLDKDLKVYNKLASEFFPPAEAEAKAEAQADEEMKTEADEATDSKPEEKVDSAETAPEAAEKTAEPTAEEISEAKMDA